MPIRLRRAQEHVAIPGDAQASLAADLQRKALRFIWASREHLGMAHMSLAGELMRHGLAEWSGATELHHAARSDASLDEAPVLAEWVVRHLDDEDTQVRALP